MYIYICYIYIYINIYIYIYINNVPPPRFSPQWFCGSSCTWAHDARFDVPGGHIVFMITYILCSSCFP